MFDPLKPLDSPASFESNMHFANALHRGYRVPNQYSVKDPAELKTTGQTHRVTVHNARLLDPAPTLDSHGFQLVHAPCDLDLMDTEVVTSAYYEHCREVVQQITGCFEVRGGGHEYRNGFGGQSGERGIKPTPNGSGGGYGMGIHSDMCAAVEDAFAKIVPDERHFQSLNIWRSVKRGELVFTAPLGMCDMRSVDPADIVFGDGTATGNIKQYYKVVDQRVVFSPSQRWYCFPNMTEDEVLVFRQYDTRQEPLNLRTVFHSAVVDPNTPDDAPMRYTIEVRMQAIFEKETDKPARTAHFKAQITDVYRDGTKSDWWRGPIENYVPPADA
ncbi:MAG: hypothetical protein F4W90_03915 [Gammaproteobacteria bacterium]|nr:hypothetical protein [Gammaproteobacteria bacterium]